jgi:hypothetical protein
MKEFCKKHNITENQFLGIDEVGGSLDLRSLTSIPDGFNPTVGGGLYLNSLTSIPDGFNPTVGGSLDLRSLTSIPDGFNPTVGGGLYLNSLTSIPDGFNPTVGGGLYLRSLTSIPDGFNPTVGGDLYLRSLTSIPDGFNPTVGGGLYLNSLTSIPGGFNPTVGGSLDLRSGNKYIGSDVSSLNFMQFQNGKYILVDNMFTEVISKKGLVWKVKKYATEKTLYIATDGNGKYSHGNTIREAKDDLIYKISERSTDEYKILTLDSKLKFNEAVMCYRAITGACRPGIEDFLKRKTVRKKSFTIAEIIAITKGEYQSQTFEQFFKR